ncbi:ATP-binding protein [Streptomyces sp. cg36]|uniref:ATP-binding protein n=1 Tax=Streptomyces sp. cg36 TaxID=3238798 RepID=UPI0034E2BFFF
MRRRLVVTCVLVALLSTVTATALAYREARDAVLHRSQATFEHDLRTRVDALAPDVDLPPDQRALTAFARTLAAGLAGTPLVVARYENVSGASDPAADQSRVTAELRAAVRGGSRAALQRVTFHGEPYLAAGLPVTYENGGASRLEVFAVTPLRDEADDTAALLDAVRDGLLPVLALTALLALLAARTVLRPVRDLGRATHRLADGDLSVRVEPRGSDELAQLAADFNTTADALQASVGELRDQEAKAKRFVADVSHELRTPLAAMTMVATVLDEDADQLPPDAAHAARTVSAETARLSRLVDDLMEMSRFDSGAARLHRADTDLGDVVRSALALRGWTGRVRTQLAPDVRAAADRRRVDVAVANLVGNALRHGAPPVEVTLTVDASPEPGDGDAPAGTTASTTSAGATPATGTATITVADRGPGLPPEALAHVFDRFYKAEAARTRSEGSGLGTAIALENVRLHGGTITAANRTDGPGAVFTLRLPLHTGADDGTGDTAAPSPLPSPSSEDPSP